MRKPMARGADGRPIFSYRRGPARRVVRDDPEARLQKAVVQLLEYTLAPEVVWTASLSGVRLGPQAAAGAKALGLRRGCPDIVIIEPRKGAFWMELKSEAGSLSPDQRRWREAIGAARFALIRSVEEAEDALQLRWGIPQKPYSWTPDGRIALNPG